MLVMGYHTKELALDAFALEMSKLGDMYDRELLKLMQWRRDYEIITIMIPETEDYVPLGILWELKGMFIPCPTLNEVVGNLKGATVFRL